MATVTLKDGTVLEIYRNYNDVNFVMLDEAIKKVNILRHKKTFIQWLLRRPAKQMAWTLFFIKLQDWIQEQNLGYYCFSEDQHPNFDEVLKYGTFLLGGVVAEAIAKEQPCVIVDFQPKVNKEQEIKHIKPRVEDTKPDFRPMVDNGKFKISELQPTKDAPRIILAK
jgi:hypothetical protein